MRKTRALPGFSGIVGEVEKINNEYVVTDKAIRTIEKYEEKERRHTEAVKLQRKMLWLTIIAVVFAIVQSGITKVPTIFDFSDIPGNENSHNKANSANAKAARLISVVICFHYRFFNISVCII